MRDTKYHAIITLLTVDYGIVSDIVGEVIPEDQAVRYGQYGYVCGCLPPKKTRILALTRL